MRKNIAGQSVGFKLVSATDGSSVTGASVTVRVCLDGTWGDPSGSVSEPVSGEYVFSPSQADTNANEIEYSFVASGAVTAERCFSTTAADPSDAVRLGLSALPNADAGASGGLPLSQDSSGRVDLVDAPNATAVTAIQAGLSTFAVGQQVDLVDAPNATAIAAIQLGLSTFQAGDDVNAATIGGNVPVQTSGKLWVLDGSGNAIAPASTALSNATWTNTIAGRIDVAISTRGTSTYAGGAVASVTGDVGGNVVGSVGSVTNPVTLTSAYDAAKTAAQAGDAMTLTSGERDSIADAYLDRADAIETGITPRLALRYCSSILVGVVSGGGTSTETFKGIGVATTRVTVTADASGNRLAVVLA